MSLVFTLLQKDYIILAADNRHTRGDPKGTYANDHGVKTIPILNNRGMLGFAGQDFGERIIFPAKVAGMLDNKRTLSEVAAALSIFAIDKYAEAIKEGIKPVVQILLAAFENENGIDTARFALLQSSSFNVVPGYYPYARFEIIGKSTHGSLYALHRFGNQELPQDAAERIAALTLSEICQCDVSTGLGEGPRIFVIPKHGECRLADNIPALVEWARNVGKSLGDAIISGVDLSGSKRDP